MAVRPPQKSDHTGAYRRRPGGLPAGSRRYFPEVPLLRQGAQGQFEIRSTKHETLAKTEIRKGKGFGEFEFGISDLFRISVFRISCLSEPLT